MIHTTLEKIAIVQAYIHHKKGIEVEITPPANGRQMILLEQAYQVAKNHIKL